MRRHAWKQVTKRRWMIPSVIAVVILLAGIGYYLHTLQSKKSTETTAQTTAINTGDIILSGTGPGTLISGEEVSFGFENGGQVTEVLAGLGEKVEAGEILARLENKTLTLKYKQAAANLAALSTPS